MPVDVRIVEFRRRDEWILQVILILDVLASLGAPTLKHIFKIVVVDVDGKAKIGHDRKVGRYDVRQHPTLNHRDVYCRDISDRQFRITVQLGDLRGAVIENLIEKISQLFTRRVF